MTINQRIRDIIRFKKINQPKLAEICGVTKSSIQGICADKQEKVGSHILSAIVKKYRDINPYWLLTGEGEMIGDPVVFIDEPEQNLHQSTLTEVLKNQLKDKEEINAMLKDKIIILEDKVSNLEKFNKHLEQSYNYAAKKAGIIKEEDKGEDQSKAS